MLSPLRSPRPGKGASAASAPPPAEVAADHQAIVDLMETRQADLEAVIAAAAASDIGAIFDIEAAVPVAFCATAKGLSETIRPVAQLVFDANDPDCR